ncbi:Sec-independent protein translocase subunit TatA [Frankia sp. R82]|uniref:Sec-independent protein translocase subunit TatA n=1 Tax=Frankia sp. R82 TaxID=2950553 RepID=UPI002044116B|nr:Sec-independent protein translocase subunit TatA [Frankia sp. R82]MCM3883356.1 Sec-independent protein translocase subunit TatA [Frankia sp. R82]
MGEFGPWHILIVAAVFLILFGSRRLPDAARSLGQSLRIFKAETRALHAEDTQGALPTAPTAQVTAEDPPPGGESHRDADEVR